MENDKHVLACDIGGTKTNLAIVSKSGGPLNPVSDATFKSSDFPDATALIKKFLSEHHVDLEIACIGVAGPVIDNQSYTTNLPWFLDGEKISQAIGVNKVTLVNDLEATAASIPLLKLNDLFELNQGKVASNGNIAVISPGTGLGEGFLVWNPAEKSYIPHASEGGHSDFAPLTEAEIDLLIYLRDIIGHVSYESVCSGRGLPNIYNFLKDSGFYEEPEWLKIDMDNASDPTKLIIETALNTEKRCELCSETVNMFVSVLGAEAGNLAIKIMATGGVFIGGGIPPRITNILDSSIFLKGFFNKGRISNVLTDIPVKVILDPKAPLKGAAQIALDLLEREA